MEDKISIIVPVYNGEKYIKRCLDSLIKQNYKNIEIIVVNNASTDNTLEKIKEVKDNRIKVFSITEKGVSNARNYGIEQSTGNYIIFIDCDDWIEKDMLLYMINKFKETNCDIVRVNYFINKIEEKNYCIGRLSQEYKESTINNQDKKQLIKDIIIGKIPGYMVLNLIKKDIIKNNKIYFDKNIIKFEDKLFFIQLIMKCNKIYSSDRPFYHYFYNMNSAMHKNKNYEKDLSSRLLVNKKVNDVLRKNYSEFIKDNNNVTIYGIDDLIFDIYRNKGKRKAIEFCKQIEKNENIEELFKNINYNDFIIFKHYNYNRIKCLKSKNYKKLMKIYFYEKVKYILKGNLVKIKTLFKNYF